jgi:putative two-component system response regulator
LGFALGAVDFIHKPVSPPIVNARIRMQLALKVAADEREDRNTYLEREVDLRTQEIERRLAETRASQDVTLVALALLAETRDNETGNHLFRTQHYVRTLATHLQNHPKFSAYLSDVVIDQLFKAAPLHDIGKVGIPDRILLMPGRLDPQDFEIMKTHAEIGQKAIANAQQRVGTKIPLLDLAMEIAHGHHEKWDGSGYPQALAGEDIPLSARLMALADVYDALISRRVYKAAMPHEQAVSIMAQDPGCHFDPDLLDAFLRVQDQFRAIAERFADQGEPEIMKFNP